MAQPRRGTSWCSWAASPAFSRDPVLRIDSGCLDRHQFSAIAFTPTPPTNPCGKATRAESRRAATGGTGHFFPNAGFGGKERSPRQPPTYYLRDAGLDTFGAPSQPCSAAAAPPRRQGWTSTWVPEAADTSGLVASDIRSLDLAGCVCQLGCADGCRTKPIARSSPYRVFDVRPESPRGFGVAYNRRIQEMLVGLAR